MEEKVKNLTSIDFIIPKRKILIKVELLLLFASRKFSM